MALFLSNKMYVLSAGLDGAGMPAWDRRVRMPAMWKPCLDSRLSGLGELFLLAEELKQNPAKLAGCRQTSYELYTKRFFWRAGAFNAALPLPLQRFLEIGNNHQANRVVLLVCHIVPAAAAIHVQQRANTSSESSTTWTLLLASTLCNTNPLCL